MKSKRSLMVAMKSEIRILILEDDEKNAKMMEFELRRNDLQFVSRQVHSRRTFARELAEFTPDVVLSGYDLFEFKGLSALDIIKKQYPDVPFILVAEAIGEEKTIELLKSGISDYVLRHRLSGLTGSVRRVLREAEHQKKLRKIEQERKIFLFQLGKRVTELTVLNQISNILRDQKRSPAEVFKEIVDIMPMAWQYPNITAARILFKNEEFKTANFVETPWRQMSKFFAGSIPAVVEIFYLEEMPNDFEGPFLSEERTLLNMIAEMLKFYLERRRATQALKHNESLFRTVLETLPVGVWMINKDRNIVLENSACRNILGGEASYTTCPFHEKLGWWPDTQNRIKAYEWPISKVFDDGEPLLNTISRIRCLDGACKTIVSSAVPIRNAHDEVIAAIEVNEDVTDQKQAELALRESEKKYSTLVESSLTGIYINQDGRIIFLNNQFAEIYGYRREELIGIESWKLVYPEDRPRVEEFRKKRLRGESIPMPFEARGLKKDGTIIWVERINSVIEYNGKLCILGNLVDITARKQMEQELKRSHEELRYLSAQILKAQEDERKKISRDLHDTIAQNLLAIKVFLEDKSIQIRNRRIPENFTLDDLVDMTQRSVQELRRIMSDLRPSILDNFGLIAAINWHCGEFQKSYPHIEMHKRFNVRENSIPEALKTVIYRVFQEAMNNVAKHSRANSVYLILRNPDGRIEMIIRDNGVGFDFKRATSQSATKKKFGLIGMKERSEFSNGSFYLKSRKRWGTLVKVSWKI